MSNRFIRPAFIAAIVAGVSASLAAPVCFAADAPATGKKEAAAAEAPQQAKLTTLSCTNLKLKAAWKGAGVTVVDYYAAGTPVLQVRQDPSPAQTSTEITFGKEWGGRTVDVRIWDKDIKLLDTKSVDCKAPA
jgi:hypothetical protein